MTKMTKRLAAGLCALLLTPALAGCAEPRTTIEAENLSASITPRAVDRRDVNDAFSAAYTDFAAALLKGSAAAQREDNLLLSPLSAMIALSMATAGAEGETRSQMETLLGGLPYDELQEMLATWVDQLTKRQDATVQVANSMWVKKDFTVQQAFLQNTADYYKAEVFTAPFNDDTVTDVNLWIKEKTNGLIPKMLEQLDEDAKLLLINTLFMDAEWWDPYKDGQIKEGTFHGTQKDTTAEMLYSVESSYLYMDGAVGFRKSYKGNLYFAAMLPDEGTDIADFAASLTGAQINEFLNSSIRADVHSYLPSFEYDCAVDLTQVLQPLAPLPFDQYNAGFSQIAEDGEPLYISRVLQNTTVKLDRDGTTAGAATIVEMQFIEGMEPPVPVYEVVLDRPFVYFLCDSTTKLPLFVGIVEQIGE